RSVIHRLPFTIYCAKRPEPVEGLTAYRLRFDNMETIRQQMIVLLTEKEMSARELSQAIGIREKEVYEHLPHIARSVAVQKQKLIIQPAQCLGCGYVFKDRKRFTRPGRCPHCKQSHLDEPRYLIS
ncbi:MAG: hypothetical protein WBG51_02535, partial [Syntrophobacteria bacterium]